MMFKTGWLLPAALQTNSAPRKSMACARFYIETESWTEVSEAGLFASLEHCLELEKQSSN